MADSLETSIKLTLDPSNSLTNLNRFSSEFRQRCIALQRWTDRKLATRIEIRRRKRDEGDCWSSSEQIWDGQAFHRMEAWTTGMCRHIRAGGTWHLPTFVTRVVHEDGTPWNDSGLRQPRQ
jgi:hypothetical protein